MKKDDLFICYSNKLKNRLVNNNIKYIIHGFNKKSNKDFWVFIRNEKLNYILDNWNLGVYKIK